MKKHNLLKIIAICFIVVVVLSWVIPTGGYSGSTYTAGTTSPVGLVNLFRLPIMTFQTFIQYFIVFCAIGGFYGILNKTGVYSNIIKGIADKKKGKEKSVLITIVVTLAVLAALTGNTILLFVTIPFLGAVLLTLGYDKVTAVLATIGSILVGQAGSIFGFTGAGYIKNMLKIEMTDELITKIIVFLLLLGLFIFFITKVAKLTTKEEIKEVKETKKTSTTKKTTKTTTKKEAIKETVKKITKKETKVTAPLLYEEEAKTKSSIPLIVFVIVLMLLCFVGMYNWYYAFGVELFNNLHTNIGNIKIGDYAIVSNILNGVSSLGYWNNYELSVALLIGAVIIAWLYNVSINDFIDGVAKGIKDMLPVAFIATICNVVFTVMILSDTNISMTVISWIAGLAKSFSLPIVWLMSIVGSLFDNDFYYLLADMYGALSSYDAVYYPIIGVVTTALYNIMMMLLPTSLLLVAGLKLFDVSYKEWLKAIWKYLLEALVVIILVSIIVVILI